MKRTVLSVGAAAMLLAAIPAGAQQGPYQVEEGTVDMALEIMGMTAAVKVYFDQFGSRSATFTSIEMMGQQMEQASVIAGGFTTTWDMTQKEGVRTPVGAGSGGPLDMIAGLTQERRAGLNYKEIEGKEVLGRPTSGFSIDSGGMSMSVYQWKGIPMEILMSAQGMTFTMRATALDTTTPVAEERFLIPQDVRISDDVPAPEE